MLDKFLNKSRWIFLYIVWIVSLKGIADWFDFKVQHNSGFWSLTHGFWDAWHMTENLLLLSIFIPLGIVMKYKKMEWVFYILIMLLLMWIPHELILHGKI